MNECCDIDQLIVNAAISHGIMSKLLCTFWAYIPKIWKHTATQSYNLFIYFYLLVLLNKSHFSLLCA